ncbi:glycosyltransferase family 39 protein [Mycobacterium sp.]|uniref:glycosyltransferase family 39 protein n=1 Tax=Mycobacterium sp. TaxID=1785 RepID=UPI003D6AACBD
MAVSIAQEPTSAIAKDSPPPRRRGRLFDPLALAVLAAVVSGTAASRPSLWYDEGATISAAASRSLSHLWRLLGHIDAVHGLYYLLMHGWFAVFPPTEFWTRAPSCLAVGAAAAGVVVFAKQFAPRMTAVCAGVVFAILPRVTWAGIEARPYAFSAVAAVWLTVLLVLAIRRNRWWLWLLYALALMVSVLLNVYLVLLVPAYAVVVPVLGRQKSIVIRWAITSAAAVGIMTPFMLFTHGQVFQVAWISPLNWHNVIDAGQHQYFENSVPFGILAAIVIVVAAIAARRAGSSGSGGDTRRLVLVCAAWIVIPTAVTLIYSAFGDPVYYARYLTFTAPAMAVVLAVCITAVAKRRWAVAGVLILFAGAALPNYLFSQRTTYAKESWDYSQVADLISAHAKPGDCLLVDNTVGWKPGPIRALPATRPAAFAPLADIERAAPGPEYGHLWDGHIAVWLVLPRLGKCSTVWTISSRDKTLPDRQSGRSLPPGPLLGHAPVYQFEGELGFRIVERWQFHRTQVVESTR